MMMSFMEKLTESLSSGSPVYRINADGTSFPNLSATEPWTSHESLFLASKVLQFGDSDWTSVAQALETGIRNRPPGWFTVENVSSRYEFLLKKEREPGSEEVNPTPEILVQRLKQNRISELKAELLKQEKEIIEIQNDLNVLETYGSDPESIQIKALRKKIFQEEIKNDSPKEEPEIKEEKEIIPEIPIKESEEIQKVDEIKDEKPPEKDEVDTPQPIDVPDPVIEESPPVSSVEEMPPPEEPKEPEPVQVEPPPIPEKPPRVEPTEEKVEEVVEEKLERPVSPKIVEEIKEEEEPPVIITETVVEPEIKTENKEEEVEEEKHIDDEPVESNAESHVESAPEIPIEEPTVVLEETIAVQANNKPVTTPKKTVTPKRTTRGAVKKAETPSSVESEDKSVTPSSSRSTKRSGVKKVCDDAPLVPKVETPIEELENRRVSGIKEEDENYFSSGRRGSVASRCSSPTNSLSVDNDSETESVAERRSRRKTGRFMSASSPDVAESDPHSMTEDSSWKRNALEKMELFEWGILEAPEYPEGLVKSRINSGSIKIKVENKDITTFSELQRDLCLLLMNVTFIYPLDSELHEKIVDLKNEVNKTFGIKTSTFNSSIGGLSMKRKRTFSDISADKSSKPKKKKKNED